MFQPLAQKTSHFSAHTVRVCVDQRTDISVNNLVSQFNIYFILKKDGFAPPEDGVVDSEGVELADENGQQSLVAGNDEEEF